MHLFAIHDNLLAAPANLVKQSVRVSGPLTHLLHTIYATELVTCLRLIDGLL